MNEDDLICICIGVTRRDIISSINAGHNTIDEIKAHLYCCTGCGTCEPKVKKILEETLANAQMKEIKE